MKTFEVAYLGIKTVVSQDLQTLKESYSYANYPIRDELPEAFIDEETDEEFEVIGFDNDSGVPIVVGDPYFCDADGNFSLVQIIEEDDE